MQGLRPLFFFLFALLPGPGMADTGQALPVSPAGSATVAAGPKELEASWHMDLDTPERDELGDFEHVDWSATGSCAVVETPIGLSILRPDGGILWKRPFSRTMIGTHFRSMAVSKLGDVVALGGESDNKKIWFFFRNSGNVVSFKCRGTPWVLRFSLDGKLLAATTGADRAYLFNSAGKTLWSGAVHDLLLAWPGKPGGVGKNVRPKSLWDKEDVHVLLDGAYSALDGTRYSNDAHWAVEWGVPNHGSDIGWLNFEQDGIQGYVWQKYTLDSLDVLISADGKQVLAMSQLVTADRDKIQSADLEGLDAGTNFYLFDRTGNQVKSWPAPGDGNFLGFSKDERSFVYSYSESSKPFDSCVEKEDMDGNVVWLIRSASITRPLQYFLSPDHRWILNYQGNELSGYEVGL